jgi:hypothetical protein
VTIKQMAMLGTAAECLYYNHAGFYGLDVPDWKTLPRETRDQWIESAKDAIEGVGQPRATPWQAYGKVIARITPDAPWGETA